MKKIKGNPLSLHPMSLDEALTKAMMVPPPMPQKKIKDKSLKVKN